MNLKNTFGLFLNFSLGILSYVIPKNNNLFVFGSRLGFAGNPKFFLLYLLKNRKNYTCYWIVDRKETLNLFLGGKIPAVYLWSIKGFFLVLRAHFLIYSHEVRGVSYSRILIGKFNKINTWHGSGGIKKSKSFPQPLSRNSLGNYFEKFWLPKEKNSQRIILSCSERWKLKKSKTLPVKSIKILGYPRNDIFFDKSLIYETSYGKLQLEKFTKIILYCPTFREGIVKKTPFSKEFLQDLNEYLKSSNYLFLIKKHHNDKILNIKSLSNIQDISGRIQDVQELLVHIDILITDYSSIAVDYCLTNRPIIFYPYDLDFYKKTRGLDINYFHELPGFFAHKEDEILEYIKKITQKKIDVDYQKKYKKFRNLNHKYLDGESSKRLIAFLESM